MHPNKLQRTLGLQPPATSSAISIAVRHARYVPTRSTARPAERTPFISLLALRMHQPCACLVNRFFALAPDHGSVAAGGDETFVRMNTWWVRSLVCLSAGQFTENRLENIGLLMWKWMLEYQPRWKRDDTRRFQQQQQHLYLRHVTTVKNLCDEVIECTRKHSESELVRLTSAEFLDVLHARFLDQATHTPASAKRIKKSGKRIDAR